MRISDWSSDVCSSDLADRGRARGWYDRAPAPPARRAAAGRPGGDGWYPDGGRLGDRHGNTGYAGWADQPRQLYLLRPPDRELGLGVARLRDRKSTRLNSSH